MSPRAPGVARRRVFAQPPRMMMSAQDDGEMPKMSGRAHARFKRAMKRLCRAIMSARYAVASGDSAENAKMPMPRF